MHDTSKPDVTVTSKCLSVRSELWHSQPIRRLFV